MNTKETNQKSTINNPTLSLCMIVKDEEQLLPICLDSVKDYVDEIIIVDTGSTDTTVEIAKRYNAKVYHHPWENSFSKARNYSLRYATGDWIIWIDADEEVDKRDAHKLKNVIRDDEVNVIYLPMFNRPIGGKAVSVFNAEKIFRNHIGIHFEGIVHNNLKYSGLSKSVNIKLYHYGYNQGEEQMEKKFVRTSSLLRLQIKDDPENPTPHHYLAISCLERQRHEECIKEVLEAIRLFELKNSNSQFRLLSYYTACVAFYRMQDLNNAEKYALKAISFYPDYLDAHCILTSIYFLRKEYDKCAKETEKYLKLLESLNSDPSKALVIPYNTLQDAWLAHTRISINCFEQGNEIEGLQSLKNAINSADYAWRPYLAIGQHFAEHNNFKMADRFLCDGLKHDPGNKEIQYYLAGTYENAGESEKAIACFKDILKYHPDEVPAQYNLGLLLLKDNKPDEAIKVFMSAIDKEPKHIAALSNIAVAYERTGNFSEAKATYVSILEIEPENAEVLVRLGSLYLNELDYTMAKDHFLRTIILNKYLLEAHLAMSRINIFLKDLESCTMNCDELLKELGLPRNVTINCLTDLSELYVTIGADLMKQQKGLLANVSFEIAGLLAPDPGKTKMHKLHSQDTL